MKLKTYQGLNFRPFIENERIRARVSELGRQITAEYEGHNPC